ncbi:hypothetical protein ACMD2_05219, partial [Ananas comosus]
AKPCFVSSLITTSPPILLPSQNPSNRSPAQRRARRSAMDEIRLRQEKVEKFEGFVDRRLKPDLVNAIAQRPDTRRIFVDIGLGFHVEFTWSEALEFISVREARLAR